MLGAIAGDVIGSVHEGAGTKTKHFPLFTTYSRFTDDTVLTVAVAEALLDGRDYVDVFHESFHAYPHAGYGGMFIGWCVERRRDPYFSFGNGAAMRVAPIAWAFDSLEDVLREAERCAAVTHDHPEGIRGAQATAAAIYLARTGRDKAEIRQLVASRFGYDLDRTLDDIRPRYDFQVSCQRSVPESMLAFLESMDFEDAVRNAVSLGGDADTMACIAGAIAEAHYGEVPARIADPVRVRLEPEFLAVVDRFREQFGGSGRAGG
jgi:ADP-ribosylglycohydrolase